MLPAHELVRKESPEFGTDAWSSLGQIALGGNANPGASGRYTVTPSRHPQMKNALGPALPAQLGLKLEKSSTLDFWVATGALRCSRYGCYPRCSSRFVVMARPNWSRPLPRPLVIPTVMTLCTLADVRELMRHLPTQRKNYLRPAPSPEGGGEV